MAGRAETDRGLAAARRTGAEFGLGACTGAWSGRRYSPRIVCGALVLTALACGLWIAPLALSGTARAVTGGLCAAILGFGILLIALPPRSWTDRLFAFQGGVVLLDVRDPEPQALRWPQLEAVAIALGSSYDDYYLSSVTLRWRGGERISLGRHLRGAFSEVVATAERVLAPALVPAAIAALDAGLPVTIGPVTASVPGLTIGAGPLLAWGRLREVAFDSSLEGQHVTVRADGEPKGGWSLQLEGLDNAFVLRYLIAHVAAVAGFRVSGHAGHWDGESRYDPDATLAAPPPGPGLAPPPEPGLPGDPGLRRARGKRHPVRTAFLVAALAGILAGWALSYDYGPAVMPSCSAGCDSGDHVASSGRLP